MKKFAFMILAGLLMPLAAVGQFNPVPPQMRECDPGFIVAAQAVPQPMPPAKAGQFQLGRAIPKKQYDYGRFRAVVGSDGKTRFFPRLGKNTDSGNRKTPLPDSVDWSTKAANVLSQMYLNDQLGCCVWSSRYHQIGFQTAADTGTGLVANDSEVYAAYQAACGRGDNGCDMSAVNVYQQKTGCKVKGVVHKTDGSVAIDNTNKDIVRSAIVVFGGINVGMSLPADWYQSADGSDWGITNSRIVGGHEVQAYGYDTKGVWISTWGGKRRILWEAFLSRRWIDETYTTLSVDWYGSDKLAPNGIDAATLKADLALIASGEVPPLPGPGPGPGPGPDPVPGKGFTGTMTYKDGVLATVTPGASGNDADVKLEALRKEMKFERLRWRLLVADVVAAKARGDTDQQIDGIRVRFNITPEQWAAIIKLILELLPIFLGDEQGIVYPARDGRVIQCEHWMAA